MKPDAVERWAQLAYQYGPFFFSILFVMFVVRWAHKKYNEVSIRTAPPATDQERSVYKWEFIGCSVVGLLCVCVSIVWWWRHPPGIFLFRGLVQNLRPYEVLDTTNPEIYFRSVLRSPLKGEEQLRNERFIALRFDGPFTPSHSIPIEFSKGEGKRTPFEIPYTADEPEPTYVIEWNDQTQRNVLKRVGHKPSGSMLSPLVREAHAQQEVAPYAAASQSSSVQPPSAADDRCTTDIATLQDSSTDVGAKIAAADDLGQLDDARFRDCLSTRTKREPLLVTFIDLSRHDDPELASKSRGVLRRFDVDQYLIQQLSKPESAKAAEPILLRLDRNQAEAVLKRAGAEQSPSLKKLSGRLSAGDQTQMVRPSGSAKGDRYYVEATWDPKRQDVVDCLTRLFNAELISRRSLADEAALMSGRRERLVYWYDKEWAIAIANKVERCGGKASFVNPK